MIVICILLQEDEEEEESDDENDEEKKKAYKNVFDKEGRVVKVIFFSMIKATQNDWILGHIFGFGPFLDS